MNLQDSIKRCALEAGFDLVGVAPANGLPDFEFAREWQRKGFAGEMHYLSNLRRFDPREVLPSVRSVVCVGLIYNTPIPYSTEVGGEAVRSQESEDSRRSTRTSPLTSGPSPLGKEWPAAVGSGEGSPRAWISRYAWGRDYHEVLRERLEKLRAAMEALAPGVETRTYVDTGPVIERAFARYSGIGWVGKNTCILNEQKGSWFFLGVILTNLDLAPDPLASDRCGSCTACLEACPTGALVEPYRMDATRCISYLTIELKGPIPVEFRAAVGNNVFGCDICQDVCPWNRSSSVVRGPWSEAGSSQWSAVSPAPSRPATTPLPDFQPMLVNLKKPETGTPKLESGNRPRPAGSKLGRESEDARAFHPQPTTRKQKPTGASNSQSSIINHQFSLPAVFSLFHTPLASLAAITEDDFRRAFLHSPIKRAKYRGWLRNLCVAMGNSGDASLVPRLQEIASGEDAMLREHAEWALERLRKRNS